MVRLVYRFYLQKRGTFQEARIIGILIFQQCVACLVIILTPYGIAILAYGNKLMSLEIICLLYQPTATYWQIVYMTVFQGLRRISSYLDQSKSCYIIITLTANPTQKLQPAPAKKLKGLDTLAIPGTKITANIENCSYNVSSLIYHKSALCSLVHLQPLQQAKYTNVLKHYSFQLKLQAPIYVKLKFADALLVQLKTTIPLCQYSRSST
uniref:Uncharacterized protein n=1 Tax=Spironucleus salmonicida TaxID=348837 RepID=V6LPC0_9EUKA|eukprot:EST45561.1 Hypothetical protein SS50377_14491 [Spironucleus salmonicida]